MPEPFWECLPRAHVGCFQTVVGLPAGRLLHCILGTGAVEDQTFCAGSS